MALRALPPIFSLAEHLANRLDQFFGYKGLEEHCFGINIFKKILGINFQIAGNQNNRYAMITGANRRQQLQAIHAGHLNIGNHEIILLPTHFSQSRRGTKCAKHSIAFLLKNAHHNIAQVFVIVNYEQFGFSHLVTSTIQRQVYSKH